jgi:hypothetical protein
MTTFDKGAAAGVARPFAAKRSARGRLMIAAVVLAAALVFQPGESRALNIGPLIPYFMGHGHHGKGHAHKPGKGPRHIARKGHPDKEKPAAKDPDGPIFSAAR